MAICHLQKGSLPLSRPLAFPLNHGFHQFTQTVKISLPSQEPCLPEVIRQLELSSSEVVEHMAKNWTISINERVAHGISVLNWLLTVGQLFQKGTLVLGESASMRSVQEPPYIDCDGAWGGLLETLAGLQQVWVDVPQFTFHPSEVPFHSPVTLSSLDPASSELVCLQHNQVCPCLFLDLALSVWCCRKIEKVLSAVVEWEWLYSIVDGWVLSGRAAILNWEQKTEWLSVLLSLSLSLFLPLSPSLYLSLPSF